LYQNSLQKIYFNCNEGHAIFLAIKQYRKGFVFNYPRGVFLEDINILRWEAILLSNVEVVVVVVVVVVVK